MGNKSKQLRGRTSTWLAVDGFVGGGAHVRVVVVSLSPRILSSLPSAKTDQISDMIAAFF